MLETIRGFAPEKLKASGEDEELCRRHGEHFFALAQEAEPHLRSDEIEWVDRLDPDLDNLRAAFDFFEASGEGQRTLRLATAISRFWYLRGLWPEGLRRVEAALSVDDAPTTDRGRALSDAAVMAALNLDYERGRRRAEESLAVHKALGDASGIASARFSLGFVAVEEGDFQGALPPLEESLRLFQELGDERRLAVVTSNLTLALDQLGEVERARTLTEDNLRRARAMGDDRLTAITLSSLAQYALRDGRIGDALSMLKESLRIDTERHEPLQIAYSLSQIASALAAAGRAETAVHLLACSVKLEEEILMNLPVFEVRRKEQTLNAVRAWLDEDAIERAWEEGRRLAVEEAVALALAATPSDSW
jgi:tetratricopeptide (TPR) repeat protein